MSSEGPKKEAGKEPPSSEKVASSVLSNLYSGAITVFKKYFSETSSISNNTPSSPPTETATKPQDVNKLNIGIFKESEALLAKKSESEYNTNALPPPLLSSSQGSKTLAEKEVEKLTKQVLEISASNPSKRGPTLPKQKK